MASTALAGTQKWARHVTSNVQAAAAEQAAGRAGHNALSQGPSSSLFARAGATLYDVEQVPQEIAGPARQGVELGKI